MADVGLRAYKVIGQREFQLATRDEWEIGATSQVRAVFWDEMSEQYFARVDYLKWDKDWPAQPEPDATTMEVNDATS